MRTRIRLLGVKTPIGLVEGTFQGGDVVLVCCAVGFVHVFADELSPERVDCITQLGDNARQVGIAESVGHWSDLREGHGYGTIAIQLTVTLVDVAASPLCLAAMVTAVGELLSIAVTYSAFNDVATTTGVTSNGRGKVTVA